MVWPMNIANLLRTALESSRGTESALFSLRAKADAGGGVCRGASGEASKAAYDDEDTDVACKTV